MAIHLPIQLEPKRPLDTPKSPYGQCGKCHFVSTEIQNDENCPRCTTMVRGYMVWPHGNLVELWKEEVFCWDNKINFRKNVYPAYKANRRENLTPSEKEEFKLKDEQEGELKKTVLRQMGFMNHFEQEGYESDDLMWVVANRLKTKKVLMVTADNDMWQCLDEHCDIINPTTFKCMTAKKFTSIYKIPPNQWPICKAIGGCNGDNVIGIQGCGDPKDLKKGPNSRTMQYIRGEMSKGKIYERITSKEGADIIQKNLPIVTLPYMPENINEPFFRRNKYTRKKFIRIFDKYYFKSFLEKDMFSQWEDVFLG